MSEKKDNVKEFPGRKIPTAQEQQKSAIDFGDKLAKLTNEYSPKLHPKTMVLAMESVKLDLIVHGITVGGVN